MNYSKTFKYYLLSRGYHVKADVLSIPETWYFLGLAVFKVELLALKVRSNLKKIPQKNLKKRQGHNFWISLVKLNHALEICVSEGVIQFHERNPKKCGCVFFFDIAYFRGRTHFFRPLLTLSNNNSR